MATKKKSNVGRKPATDPKVQVSFYVEQSKITKVGGMDKARTISIRAVEAAATNQ